MGEPYYIHYVIEVKPGMMPRFVELWPEVDAIEVPILHRHGGTRLALWTTYFGTSDQIICIYTYENLVDREAVARDMRANPEWVEKHGELESLWTRCTVTVLREVLPLVKG